MRPSLAVRFLSRGCSDVFFTTRWLEADNAGLINPVVLAVESMQHSLQSMPHGRQRCNSSRIACLHAFAAVKAPNASSKPLSRVSRAAHPDLMRSAVLPGIEQAEKECVLFLY